MNKNKRYEVTIWFNPITYHVSAKNQREAYKKAEERLAKKHASTLPKHMKDAFTLD